MPSTPSCRPRSTGSALVVRLAEQISAIDAEIADVDAQITESFRQHADADDPAQHARLRPRPGRNFPGQHRRQPERVRHRRPARQRRGPCPRPARFRPNQRQPPPTPPLQPPAPANLLPRRSLQPEEQPGLTNRTTTANAAKESPTNRPSSPSPDAASTPSGPCSATAPPTRNQRHRSPLKRLDRNIEIPNALVLICRSLLQACPGS